MIIIIIIIIIIIKIIATMKITKIDFHLTSPLPLPCISAINVDTERL